VQEADWSPDGSALAVIRAVGGRYRIEYPIGKVLYQAERGISHLRVSPDGERVAFIDHPLAPDDNGSVMVVDRAGRSRKLTGRFASAQGLAWRRPAGDEVWFTAAEAGMNMALRAVTLDGRQRVILRIPGRLMLQDIAAGGRILAARESSRIHVAGLGRGQSQEREWSWGDASVVLDLSPDGRTVLISEQGEAGGPGYGVYLRKTDGSPAVRLGGGLGAALSPDGKWVLTVGITTAQLVLLPARAGEPRPLPRGALEHFQFATWMPDGKRVVFSANEPGRGSRIYVQDIAGGAARAASPEGADLVAHTVSPDGRWVAALDPDRKLVLYPIEGGEAGAVPGVEPGEFPLRWSSDGRSLYICRTGEMPIRVHRVEVATGRRELWKQLVPRDPVATFFAPLIHATPDGAYYAYSYNTILCELYLVDGVK